MLCFSLVRERVEIKEKTEKPDMVKLFKSLLSNRSLLGIIAAAIFVLLSMLTMQGMCNYIFPNFYRNTVAQSIAAFTSNMAALVICAPTAAKLSAR